MSVAARKYSCSSWPVDAAQSLMDPSLQVRHICVTLPAARCERKVTAVRGKGDRNDTVRMPGKGVQCRAVGRIPKLERFVITRAGNRAAVRRKGNP